MTKSKFEILLDKASEVLIAICVFNSPLKRGILTGFATFFIIVSIIAIGGHFSKGIIALDNHRINNYRNLPKYCSETIARHIKENKQDICKDYTSKHINEICEPLINNLKNQDNVSTE